MDLSQDDWASQFKNDSDNIILDVRSPDECEGGIIAGAICIDIYKGQGFIYAVDELDKSKAVYVYCRSGGRSSQACAILNQLGFEKTYNLVDGFMAWQGDIVIP